MKRVRTHRWFAGALTLLVLLGTSVAWAVLVGNTSARSARLRLERAVRDLRSVSSDVPAPTEENTALIADDLETAQRVLRGVRTTLLPLDGRANERRAGTSDRAQAFFAVAALVEEMRDKAGRRGVRLKPDERFGFPGYAHDAPETAQVTAVLRDVENVRALLDVVLDARPDELMSVERELPKTVKGAARLNDAKGYFDMDARVSAKIPGEIETAAYRFTFSGRTAVLRKVLRTLANGERPLIVRMVEVTRLDVASLAGGKNNAVAGSFITSGSSRFTVVVEAIDPESNALSAS